MAQPWYLNAVGYAVEVDKFLDTDGDGVADLRGVLERLDYVEELGANCLWLLPFYVSPNRDNRYDVVDHLGIDAALGTEEDFDRLVAEARRRGIRVVCDLVANHTSIEHPWFRQKPSYYVWSDDPRDEPNDAVPGEEESLWDRDDASGRWYFHRFYRHEPDLDLADERVRRELVAIAERWLDRGAAGFRLDAVPFVVEKAGDHELLRELRRTAGTRDAALLAETNVVFDDLAEYFGSGDEAQLLLTFCMTNDVFLALARGDAEPLRRGLSCLPRPPAGCGYANFLRNHDELNLSRLDEEEQQEVVAAFGPADEPPIYGRGVRRRLAPILGGDRRLMEVAFSLLFSLPGIPIVRYGDEIGMGDDLGLAGRASIRTAMQWSADDHAGFTTGMPKVPVLEDGVSVEGQLGDPRSTLAHVRRLARLRRDVPELGAAPWEIVETGASPVLVHRFRGDSRTIVLAHNLSSDAADFRAPPGEILLSDGESEPGRLAGHGYLWLAA